MTEKILQKEGKTLLKSFTDYQSAFTNFKKLDKKTQERVSERMVWTEVQSSVEIEEKHRMKKM